VHKTHIIDGRVRHALLLEIFTEEGIGTQIVEKAKDLKPA
jgi:acetylglutamate kinase